MITGDTCRPCDGRGTKRKPGSVDGSVTIYTCSTCNGSGKVNPPSKGKRRFGSKVEETEEEMTLEQQTQAFLRKHGY